VRRFRFSLPAGKLGTPSTLSFWKAAFEEKVTSHSADSMHEHWRRKLRHELVGVEKETKGDDEKDIQEEVEKDGEGKKDGARIEEKGKENGEVEKEKEKEKEADEGEDSGMWVERVPARRHESSEEESEIAVVKRRGRPKRSGKNKRAKGGSEMEKIDEGNASNASGSIQESGEKRKRVEEEDVVQSKRERRNGKEKGQGREALEDDKMRMEIEKKNGGVEKANAESERGEREKANESERKESLQSDLFDFGEHIVSSLMKDGSVTKKVLILSFPFYFF
jgi:hypothetical protein